MRTWSPRHKVVRRCRGVSQVHLCKAKRLKRIGPVPRIRVELLLSLLIVVGLGLHMVHAGPSSSEVEAVEANQVCPEEPDRATCAGLPAVQHCGSAASCAVLPRSEESRVGKEYVSTCRYGRDPNNKKKNTE